MEPPGSLSLVHLAACGGHAQILSCVMNHGAGILAAPSSCISVHVALPPWGGFRWDVKG